MQNLATRIALRTPEAALVLLGGLSLSVPVACVWRSDLLGESWWLRGALSLLVLFTGAGALVAAIRRQKMQGEYLRSHLLQLCSLPLHEMKAERLALMTPPLPPGDPWENILARLHECLLQHQETIQESDVVRARSEVRYRRAQTQLKQMSEVFAALNEPVIAIDGFEEITLANSSAEKLFQMDAKSAEQRALSQLVKCEKLVELLADTRKRKSATQRVSELELADSQGKPLFYQVQCRTLSADDPGRQQGALAVLSDISAVKRVQQRNAEFVSAVSHEMKTPLAGIKAYVELLNDDVEDEETREEFLGVISGQADRLQRLVENLLNIARIEAGVVKVQKQSRALNELLEEAAGVVHPAAEQKQITLSVNLSPMYLGVLADRDMLSQAVINLLSNAVKYTPEGGRVELRSQLRDGAIVVEVEDTGVGLSPEDCEKVFEKFYRVNKDKNMAAGTGLGLPLAKHIVEDVHGGQISVSSTPGKGSLFQIILPPANEIGG